MAMAGVGVEFRALKNLMGRGSELAGPGFEADVDQNMELLREQLRILIVGAGGLGCEMLKVRSHSFPFFICLNPHNCGTPPLARRRNRTAATDATPSSALMRARCSLCGASLTLVQDAALSGFRHVHVIDMDTIDISNLNRQFLFTAEDVGASKAEAAARAIMRRFGGEESGGVVITPHHGRIEEMPREFYGQFHIIVLGLDSLEARSYLNSLICGFLEYDDEGNVDETTIKPMVDAGTEGFAGHTRVILPGITPCVQCTMWLYPPQTTFPLCTLAETPRNAAHCIEYVKLVQWGTERRAGGAAAPAAANNGSPDTLMDAGGNTEEFDPDNGEHMQWIYTKALERAKAFGIEGVTMRLTMGVVKNIIPAIPSTNAIMSAAAILEVLKAATMFSRGLDNYVMFSGTRGVYMHKVSHERDPTCPVCSPGRNLRMAATDTLQAFIDRIVADEKLKGTTLRGPSVSHRSTNLYMTGVLESETRPNLGRTLGELLDVNGGGAGSERKIVLSVNDRSLSGPLRVWLSLTGEGDDGMEHDS